MKLVKTVDGGTNVATAVEKLQAVENPQVVGWFVTDADGMLHYDIATGMRKDALWALERLKALVVAGDS